MKLATAEQMQALDKRAINNWGIPSLDLMDRAAGAVADAVRELLPAGGRGRCAVLCGTGNNGGDGIAAARLLFLKGVGVRVFLAGAYDKLTPDALEQTRRLSECGVELEPLDPDSEDQRRFVLSAHVCIDALFGVGLSRPIGEDSAFGAAVRWMNESRGKVVAADIASGVSADTGSCLGTAVKADKTITFTLPKIGQFVGEGALCSGEIAVADIGIPSTLVREVVTAAQTIGPDFVHAALPARKMDSHKGNFGKILVIGGAVGYTGAPYLTARAAVRAGAGLVSVGVPETVWPVLAAKCVSAMPFPLADKHAMLSDKALQDILDRLAGCDVLALGPGLGRSEGAGRLVRKLLETEKPVVLDADGINALAGHMDVLDARRGRVTILTPHDGEFVRLAPGALAEGDRLTVARTFAREHGCCLLLKGWRTIVATPAGTALVNVTGSSALAKGGSGDVLTGVIAALLGQGATPVQAAAAGAWLHGRAGELAAEELTGYGVSPEDTANAVPLAIREILQGK